MENNTVKIKIPVGAIFMIVYTIFSILFSIVVYFDELSIIEGLSCTAIAIFAMKKKRGLPILIPVALLALIDLINHNLLYFVMPACLVVFSLDDMNIGNLSKFRNTAKITLVISSGIVFALNIINALIFASVLIFARNVLYTISILLIGLWIYNPIEREKMKTNSKTSKDSSAVTSKDYYVSLGKHICLLLFTLGIWQMIWIYKTTIFTNNATDVEERNPTTKLLLCLFVPFYSIYWTYKTAQRIDIIAKDNGLTSDLATICLILAIFIGIIPPILMQEKINETIKKIESTKEIV